MYDFNMAEGSEVMDVILYGPHVPIKKDKEGDIIRMVLKTRREFNDEY